MTNNDAIVLCLGPARDPQLLDVAAQVEQVGGQAIVIDTRAVELPLQWTPQAPSVVFTADGVVVPTAAFVRTLPPRQPALARVANRQSPPLSDFVRGTVDGNGRRDLVTAVIDDIAHRGGTVLNPPRLGSLLEHKPTQLRRAVEVGLRIPKTVAVGGSADSRSDTPLGETKDAIIHKPIRGGEFAESGPPPLGRPRLCQASAPGDDVRVLLLQHQVVAAYAVRGLNTLDPRADPNWDHGRINYVEIEVESIPSSVRGPLESLTRSLTMPLCGADFKVDATRTASDWTFLEANGAPIWHEASSRLGLNFSLQVAAALVADTRSSQDDATGV